MANFLLKFRNFRYRGKRGWCDTNFVSTVKFADPFITLKRHLRGSGVVAGEISAFPIDFAGRPYNTLTLPSQRVMFVQLFMSSASRCFTVCAIRDGILTSAQKLT